MRSLLFSVAMAFLLLASGTYAQTTAFSYQGSLKSGGTAANGSFDFEFALYDAVSGGSQVGSTLPISVVSVSDGAFTVSLDFGNQFPGAPRFLEIRVRPGGGGSYTTLAPRQQIASTPYAIKSVSSDTAATATNASQLGGVAASQYVLTTDPRMTDPRSPTAESPHYIQNQITSPQPGNFFISGTGSVQNLLFGGVVRAGSHYEIGGNRVFSTSPGNQNVFSGLNSGVVNTASNNAFYGWGTGRLNTSGQSNTFLGAQSGFENLTGNANTFVGAGAGSVNTTGFSNTFVGIQAGGGHQTGNNNTLVGAGTQASVNNLQFATAIGAGSTVTTSNQVVLGRQNGSDFVYIPGSFGSAAAATIGGNVSAGSLTSSTFVQIGADDYYRIGPNEFMSARGTRNTLTGFATGPVNTGTDNSFYGYTAGSANTDGANNAFFGSTAGDANTSGDFNVFVGANAGGSNSTGSSNTFVGTSAGSGTTAGNNTFIGRSSGTANTTGTSNTLLGHNSNVPSGALSFATAIGAGAVATESDSVTLGRSADIVYIPGFLRLAQLGGAGATAVCRNNANTLGTCSSSLRYKNNVERFDAGLNLIKQLKPITFDWKDGGMRDLGLGAEDVAAIEPLLVTYNKTGQVEGVKYDRIGVVLVNALKEQQAEIESLRRQVREMKLLLCEAYASAPICKEEK